MLFPSDREAPKERQSKDPYLYTYAERTTVEERRFSAA